MYMLYGVFFVAIKKEMGGIFMNYIITHNNKKKKGGNYELI